MSATRSKGDVSRPHPSASRGSGASFGPFHLCVPERVLLKGGKPLKMGSRAFDILLTLLEHAPEVVSKRDLIERAWGKLVVDEVSLRVHVAALRKRLGDGDSPGGYITNVPGRGYSFAGGVTWTAPRETQRSAPSGAPQLPREPLLMVGRDNVVRELSAQLKRQRFLSIVGAGGIGKTTIALALAHRLLSEFQGAVHFLDLAALEDPRLLAGMLASQLRLVAAADQPLTVILSALRDQRILLVFDCCEHVIETVAALTENIFRDAPQVHILATSREALRAEGEQVHHLPPLACPPANAESLTAAEALGYSAVQLFVRQVVNGGHAFELTDAEAPIVAEICRRLDGIALALELAASCVGVHGIQGTATLLDKHFRLSWHGRRTALPRHQTLSATLDWSYNLLSGTEQLILRRLAVFVGGFTLEAALKVAGDSLDPAELVEALAALVEKSLVILDIATAMRYRLLDTTRVYAWRKLTENGEEQRVALRHCEYLLHALERFDLAIWAAPSPATVGFFASNLNNLRAALDWCFSDEGDTALGAKLTGASASLFFHLGLMDECVAWTGRAMRALEGITESMGLELELQACFASSIMVTVGNAPEAHAALVRALEISERLKDAPMQFYLLYGLYKWQIRSGDFRVVKELTGRVETVGKEIADPFADAIAHCLRAVTSFFTGDNRDVAGHCEIARDAAVHLTKLNVASFGHHHRAAKNISARNLWVLGYPDQAVQMVAEAVREAVELNHPATLCHVLMSNIVVAFETGDWQRAEGLVHHLSSHATKHHLLTYVRAAVGWHGHLAVSRGDLARGIDLLRTALAALREDGYELYRPQFDKPLAEGLAKAGQLELAYSTICQAVTWAESRERILDLIDLLRVKSEILMMMPVDTSEGETWLLQSLHLARERGLLSLELRSGMSLARLWAGRGATTQALDLLGPVFSRFSEGFKSRDLVAAGELLAKLRSRS